MLILKSFAQCHDVILTTHQLQSPQTQKIPQDQRVIVIITIFDDFDQLYICQKWRFSFKLVLLSIFYIK
jgi:hypothetical protein